MPLSGVGFRLSAAGCRLPAAIACWTVLPNARGFRRLRRPGSIVRALRAERWVRAGIGFAFRPGSEGSYKVHPVAAPFYNAPEGCHRNPRPEGPSNLRTLRTFGPPGPSTFTPKACPMGAATTLSREANTTLLYNPRQSRAPFLFIFAAEPPP